MTVNIKISFNGEDAPRRGAFPSGGELGFTLEIPRALGIGARDYRSMDVYEAS